MRRRRYHHRYPQVSFEAAEALSRVASWWLVLGGVVGGLTGYLHFSRTVLTAEVERQEGLAWVGTSLGRLTEVGLQSSVAMLLGGLFAGYLLAEAAARRLTFPVRVGAGVCFTVAAIFGPAFTVAAYELLRSLIAPAELLTPGVSRVLLGATVLLLAVVLLLGVQAYAAYLAFRETFQKHPHPVVTYPKLGRIATPTAQDLPSLRRLFQEAEAASMGLRRSAPLEWSELGVERELSRCRVFRRGREVLGFSVISTDPARLQALVVAPSERRGGVGSLLLRDFEMLARERGLAAVTTSFRQPSPAGEALLLAAGWGVSPLFDGEGRPLWRKTFE